MNNEKQGNYVDILKERINSIKIDGFENYSCVKGDMFFIHLQFNGINIGPLWDKIENIYKRFSGCNQQDGINEYVSIVEGRINQELRNLNK